METPTDNKTKSELVDNYAALLAERPVGELKSELEEIKTAFYKLQRAEHEAARRAFVEGGGDPEAFELTVDEDEVRLKELIAEYRKKRDEHLAALDASYEQNHKTKLAIIEELKALIGAGETVGQTFNAFRELQGRWRATGPVPPAAVKDLWETYNHHVENFYDYIKINKDLRDLDFKKNYEAKLALCEAAEALLLETQVVQAFNKLQVLHEQWRETGPVAPEQKEILWERFKEASARINKAHQAHFDELKEEQKKNLELKSALCEEVEALAGEPRTTRKEWERASERLLEIQKVWKTIGFAPKKENTQVYERFRAACDLFFEAKRAFYGEMKGEMEQNLALKTQICEAAEALQESEDWKAAGDELIALQKRWQDIGPIPRRVSDAMWKRFRAACDRFFERKADHFKGAEDEQKQNLEAKRTLLAEGAARDLSALTFDDIKDFQRRWGEAGRVPIKQKDAIAKEYKELVDKMFAALRGGEKERSLNNFKERVSTLRQSGDKRLDGERGRLKSRVKQLEGDIATLENNIGFFGRGKGAEKLIADVQAKIDRAKGEMQEILEKIKLIDKQQ